MIRAAGQYVRATDDLRPRVLEAARVQRGERWAQRCICRVGMFTLLLAFFTAADRHGIGFPQSHPTGALMAGGFDELISPAASAAPRSGDGDWRMIEAFTELRRQQAQVLRFAM
jgi:hypothetical protein